MSYMMSKKPSKRQLNTLTWGKPSAGFDTMSSAAALSNRERDESDEGPKSCVLRLRFMRSILCPFIS